MCEIHNYIFSVQLYCINYRAEFKLTKLPLELTSDFSPPWPWPCDMSLALGSQVLGYITEYQIMQQFSNS